jgi:hypothetical protein
MSGWFGDQGEDDAGHDDDIPVMTTRSFAHQGSPAIWAELVA